MKQPIYLLSLTLSGIKNIDKEITLNFYKKTVDKSFDPENYKVKAVYGENGSGKTAIVLGVQLLKDLLLENNYLGDSANQKYLKNIINKKTSIFHIECEFLCRMNGVNNIYRYSITLEKNEQDRFFISKEFLFYKSSIYPTAKYKRIFTINYNDISVGKEYDSLKNVLNSFTANLLTGRSLIDILTDRLEDFPSGAFIMHLGILRVFACLIITSIADSERQEKTLIREYVEIKGNLENVYGIVGNITPKIDWIEGNKRIVLRDNIEVFEKDVKKLQRFIQLFKHDLEKIEIEKKDDREYVECSLNMVYDGYKVHIDFESTGIKKLVALFDYLTLAMDGKIVFIDEMDSNINDIYLCKIVEFFKLYGNGQLCFTTHSTSPMEVLKDSKNAIDFLSSDCIIVPWKKNGNYTPESLYRRGMIEYLPFNIEAEDFLGIIGD